MEEEEINSNPEIRYFFDSYAIIEILKESPNYSKFEDEPITILMNNLIEIYWHCINDPKLEKEADNIFSNLKNSVVDIDDETLKEAVKFRKHNKKRDISYTDAMGYIYAKNNNLKFLTGDNEFEFLDNVQFVK